MMLNCDLTYKLCISRGESKKGLSINISILSKEALRAFSLSSLDLDIYNEDDIISFII